MINNTSIQKDLFILEVISVYTRTRSTFTSPCFTFISNLLLIATIATIIGEVEYTYPH